MLESLHHGPNRNSAVHLPLKSSKLWSVLEIRSRNVANLSPSALTRLKAARKSRVSSTTSLLPSTLLELKLLDETRLSSTAFSVPLAGESRPSLYCAVQCKVEALLPPPAVWCRHCTKSRSVVPQDLKSVALEDHCATIGGRSREPEAHTAESAKDILILSSRNTELESLLEQCNPKSAQDNRVENWKAQLIEWVLWLTDRDILLAKDKNSFLDTQ